MSDDNKLDEYNRIAGVKKTYVHETAFEDGLVRTASKRESSRTPTRIVKRYGDIPSDKGTTITISKAQYVAYEVISGFLKTSGKDDISVKAIRDVGIRAATIKALEKAELILVCNDKISIYKRHQTPEERMKEHGVGKIVIIMGVN